MKSVQISNDVLYLARVGPKRMPQPMLDASSSSLLVVIMHACSAVVVLVVLDPFDFSARH